MFNLSADCTQVKEYPPLTFDKERAIPCLGIVPYHASPQLLVVRSHLTRHIKYIAVFYNKASDYVLCVRIDATLLLFDFSIYEKREQHLVGFQGHIASIA